MEPDYHGAPYLFPELDQGSNKFLFSVVVLSALTETWDMSYIKNKQAAHISDLKEEFPVHNLAVVENVIDGVFQAAEIGML